MADVQQTSASAAQTYEDAAAVAYPPAAALVELRDEIFDVADELGIGQAVRAAWFTGGAGFRTGAAVGAGLEIAATGVAVGSGAAIGAACGLLVGVAIAVWSLLSSDDEAEERARRQTAAHKLELERMLVKLDAAGLAAEQERSAARLDSRAAALELPGLGTMIPEAAARAAALRTQADGARRFGRLWTELAKRLSKPELALVVSGANIARWQTSAAGFRGWRAQVQASIAPVAPALAANLTAEADGMLAKLDPLIRAETKDNARRAAELVKATRPIVRLPPGRWRPPADSRPAVKVALVALAAWVGWRILRP